MWFPMERDEFEVAKDNFHTCFCEFDITARDLIIHNCIWKVDAKAALAAVPHLL